MWKAWFDFCYFLTRFILSRKLREKIRHGQLYDYRKKLNALRATCTDLKFKRIKMIKGGWNIGFIIDNKYVFKIRKFYDDKNAIAKILREKAITDAFAPIVPLPIVHIEIIDAGEYIFYRYGFIHGVNLTSLSAKKITKHRAKLGKKLGEFIYAMHNAFPADIADLATPMEQNADGWNHFDLCNNIIVNPKTMNITGIIDWEYAGFGTLDSEFQNTVVFKKKMINSGILEIIKSTYNKLDKLK